MLESPDIAAMAFVGSSKAGQIIAEGCAKTNKKSMILAGAKNTAIVEQSVNISGFVKNFKNACFGAAGQRCMAAANVVVEEAVYDSVKAAMIRAAEETAVGDANDLNVYMEPVISEAAVKRIHVFIERAEAERGTANRELYEQAYYRARGSGGRTGGCGLGKRLYFGV